MSLLRKPFPLLVFNPGCEARPEATLLVSSILPLGGCSKFPIGYYTPRDGESFCSARRRGLCNSLPYALFLVSAGWAANFPDEIDV